MTMRAPNEPKNELLLSPALPKPASKKQKLHR